MKNGNQSIKHMLNMQMNGLGFHDVWTVFNESAQKNSTHSFMVLSQDASTTVSQSDCHATFSL